MSFPRLDGSWQLIRAEFEGEPAPELVVEKTQLVFETGSYLVRFDGEEVDQGTYEVSETPGASIMILRGTAGSNAGRTILCIFQLAGDRLRICYSFHQGKPQRFTAKLGEHQYLATYRRTISKTCSSAPTLT